MARGSVSMSREADLRAAREARWAAAIKANDVTLVTKSPVTKPPREFRNKGGRPAKGDSAMSTAERMRAYRARKAK